MPRHMAKAIAEIMAIPDGEHETFPVETQDPNLEADLLKAQRFPDVVIQQVKKMHDQLGHPNNRKLAQAMKGAGASKEKIACANNYVCEYCLRRQRPKATIIVALPRAKSFNDVVNMDTYYVAHGPKR